MSGPCSQCGNLHSPAMSCSTSLDAWRARAEKAEAELHGVQERVRLALAAMGEHMAATHARAEKAEAELAALQRSNEKRGVEVSSELEALEARAEAAEKRAAALEGYARHRDFCDASTDPAFPCCTACGLSALLAPTVP